MGALTIDIQIGSSKDVIAFSDTQQMPVTLHEYYVGWTTGTKEGFASKTDGQIAAIATKKTLPLYEGTFGQNTIFFLLYKASDAPSSIVFTSSGTAMAQDIEDDSTCPHDDVVVGDTNYKVFGMRFYSANTTDKITVIF